MDKKEGQVMPVGSPKPQTIATRKYEQKAGWMSKSYKLRRVDVEEFAEACEASGVSASGQLTKMMRKFVEEQKKLKDN